MKILNVNHTLDPVNGGGTAERTFQLSQQLIARGHECTILTMTTGSGPRPLPGGRVIVVPRLTNRFMIPKYLFYGILSAVREADSIHLMGHWTLLNAFVFIAAKWHGKKYAFCPAGALPIIGRSKFVKMVYNSVVGKSLARNAAVCVAITEQEKSHFSQYGVDLSKVVVIPNAVASPELKSSFTDFQKKHLWASKPYLLFVGRLSFIKGPDLLLKAFVKVMNQFSYDLVIVGPDDGMLAGLEEVVSDAGAKNRVHFVGYLGGDEKYHAFQGARFLVIPSRQEAMSIVVLEAGIVGTPALFTDQCGLGQFAVEGGGWMVPATVDGIEAGLLSVLKDENEIDAKRSSVQRVVETHYSWNSVVEKYLTVYRRLVSK